MSHRSAQADAVDSAGDTLASAAVDWLNAGGDAKLFVAWLWARMQTADARLARAQERGNPRDAKGARNGKKLVDLDV